MTGPFLEPLDEFPRRRPRAVASRRCELARRVAECDNRIVERCAVRYPAAAARPSGRLSGIVAALSDDPELQPMLVYHPAIVSPPETERVWPVM